MIIKMLSLHLLRWIFIHRFFIHIFDVTISLYMKVAFMKIHDQFTAIYVHKREGIGESLQSSRPIPKPIKKNAAMSRERLFGF